jgi:hypothetical protein
MNLLAKIKNNIVETYPYTKEHLLEENPNSSYDDRFSLKEWFEQTEQALQHGYILAEVQLIMPTQQEYTPRLQNYAIKTIPELLDGVWVLGYTLSDKTQAEKDAFFYDPSPENEPYKANAGY